jgi:hypothetical protein
MPKIRIIDPAWRNFSGAFGPVEFVDNVSVEEVDRATARKLADLVQIEWEDGTNPSNSQLTIDAKAIPMQVVDDGLQTGQPDGRTVNKTFYTREQLTAIADKDGIEGVRKIATPLGVNGRAIKGLIEAILKLQGDDPDAPQEMLIGSNLQPSEFEVDGKKIPLGDVVRLAFKTWSEQPGNATHNGVADWNALPNEIREDAIFQAARILTHGAVLHKEPRTPAAE